MRWLVRRGRHLITEHEPGAKLNDDNPGRWWLALSFIGWGYYRNSHSTESRTLISRYISLSVSRRSITYSLGIVTGYPGQPVLPFFMSSEVVRVGSRRVRIFVIPKTPLNGPAVHAASED